MIDTLIRAPIIFRLLNDEDEKTISNDYKIMLEEVKQVEKESIKNV